MAENKEQMPRPKVRSRFHQWSQGNFCRLLSRWRGCMKPGGHRRPSRSAIRPALRASGAAVPYSCKCAGDALDEGAVKGSSDWMLASQWMAERRRCKLSNAMQCSVLHATAEAQQFCIPSPRTVSSCFTSRQRDETGEPAAASGNDLPHHHFFFLFFIQCDHSQERLAVSA